MDEERIIELYFARDEEAICETDRLYGGRLYRISDNIVNSREDAQECVSDTYLRTWDSIPPKRPSKLFCYLAKICRNLSLNRVEWANAVKRRAQVVSLSQEMEQCIPDRRQEESADYRELGRIFNTFLAGLSQENQMVFLRRYWYGDSVKEIARRYGIQENAVNTRLHRLRGKLAEALQKEGIRV